jgi:hypothetical protein
MLPLRLPIATLVLLVPLVAAACRGQSSDAVLDLQEVASVAAPGSGEPNLSTGPDGGIYLSWIEPHGDGQHAVRFARWEDAGWSEPRTIAVGSNFFVNWADFPSVVALPDGRLAAHWLVRSGPGTYAYDVHIAQSADGGRNWSTGLVPHRDGTQTEHGFASLFPAGDGRLSAVWLDGRNFADAAGEEGHGSGAEMTLRYTTISADGVLDGETVLDERICDCCQTSVALTSQGPLVAYRDRSPDEIRDISVVRRISGQWTAPQAVHRDGWHIPGCPVNGPAAAARGERVVVAWFTAADENPRVHLAISADAGATFGAPVRVDDGDPIGRVDVVMLDNGDALVSWLERVGEGAEIRLRRVSAAGEARESWLIGGTSAARASGFPRMARSGDTLVFAWTEPGEPSQVRTAIARLR